MKRDGVGTGVDRAVQPDEPAQSDPQQAVFSDFAVPDAIRINKVERFVTAWFHDSVRDLAVLELGIAPGGLAERLLVKGASCYGVDINKRSMPGILFKQWDLNIGIPDFGRAFDVIFAGEVIEHVIDDAAFLRNCANALRSGGILGITTPNLAFSLNRLRLLAGRVPLFAYAPYHYHIYTVSTLKRMVEDAGLITVGIKGSHVLFSRRRHRTGLIFEAAADHFPTIAAHIILFALKP